MNVLAWAAVALSVLLMVLVIALTFRTVRADGLGFRTPPASRRHWAAGTRVEGWR
ncbi:hypothetical protein [Cellulomonas hominis]